MATAAISSLTSSSLSNSNNISDQLDISSSAFVVEVTDEVEKNHKKIASNDVSFPHTSSSTSFLTSDGTGEAVSGFLGGFFSKLLDHPLDTIKTRMQSAGSSNSTLVSTTATSNASHPFNFINFNDKHYESSNVARCNATNSQFQHHFQRHQQQNDFRISKKFVYLHPAKQDPSQNHQHPSHHHHNNNNRQCIQQLNETSKNQHHHHHPITARSCIRQIYHHDGFLGFYSGISSPLWGTALVKSLRFSIYGRVQNSMTSLYFAHDHDDVGDASTTTSKNNNINTEKKNKGNHDDSQLLLPLSLIALAGGIAGGACCVVVTPMEVTKVRCQADPRQYPGVLSCVYQTLFPPASSSSATISKTGSNNNHHGVNSNLFHHSNHHQPQRQQLDMTNRKTNFSLSNVKGLYSGFTATFLKESVGYAWWFYVYEKTLRCLTTYHQHSSSSSATFHFRKQSNNQQQQFFDVNNNNNNEKNSNLSSHHHHHHHKTITRDSLPFIDFVVAGAVSSLFFWTVFYPIDTVKTIMQTDPLRKMIYDPSTGRRSLKNLNFSETFRELWIRDPKILFRGLGVTLVRAVPSNGVTMLFYEATKKIWKEKIQQKEIQHKELQ